MEACRTLALFLPLLLSCAPASAGEKKEVKPDRWEKDIQAFEAQDKKSAPPRDAILFIGSSSIKRWNTLAKDFPEVPVINRGFGGSQIADSVKYADRLVVPHDPRLIVMYAGGNDIAAGKSPEHLLKDFQEFVDRVRKGLPEVSIAYVSVNPNIARWAQREKVQEANRLIEEFAKRDAKLAFIDSYPAFLGEDGLPKKELLDKDNLHLNAEGYKVWTSVLKPRILKLYEAASSKKKATPKVEMGSPPPRIAIELSAITGETLCRQH